MHFTTRSSVPLKEILKENALAADYCQNFTKVAPFFSYAPEHVAIKISRLEHTPAHPHDPELIADLTAYHQELEAGEKTMANIEKLHSDQTYVVITGQQPGVMTGPLYAIYKAISAITLAESLSKQFDETFIPLYWNATEDHDFEEINHLYIIDKQQSLQKLTIDIPEHSGNQYVGSLPLDASQLIKEFKEHSLPTEFTDEVITLLTTTAAKSQTLGDWFSRLMLALLGKYGLIMVDPCRPTFRKLSAPLFKKAINDPLLGTKLINETGAVLEKAGYQKQLDRPEHACSFFLVEEGKRTRVLYKKGIFQTAEQSYTKEDLFERLKQHPEDFSASVALRPLLADKLFHTAATILGPGEIAYFAQLKRFYEAMQVPLPIIIPRLSLSIIEKKVQKALEQWQAEPIDLKNDIAPLLEQAARQESVLASSSFWETLRHEALSPLTRSISSAQGEDPTLAPLFENAHTKVAWQLNQLEDKCLQRQRKKNKKQNDQLKQAQQLLFPRNNQQERSLNIFYFLNKYGFDFLDKLVAYTKTDCTKHDFLEINF